MARRKKQKRQERLKNAPKPNEFGSPLGSIAACLMFFIGIILIIIGYTQRSQCKMHAIDSTSWNKSDLDGNLIKWFKYSGWIFLMTGILANCTVGACPATMTTACPICCCPCLCGMLSDIFTGVCGKMLLFAMYLVCILCTALGQFWLYMASLYRTRENSELQGSINYCAPFVWYTAQATVKIFWTIICFSILGVLAKIHRSFFRSQEELQKPLFLGGPPPSKLLNKIEV